MNVIIIDDLIHVVKGISDGVNWEKLGVLKIYEAYNGIEAQKVFVNNTIDIMICDIEMPMASGIELLEWVKNNSPKTECIFLTSHSEFEYAKAALKLGSFDYLLQPIKYQELEAVIAKAIEKVQADHKKSTYYKYGVFWQENRKDVLDKFWVDVLKGTFREDYSRIEKAAQCINLIISNNITYTPVLVHIMRREIALSDWDDSLLKYALANILGELLEISVEELTFVQIESGKLVLIIPEKDYSQNLQLIQRLNTFLHVCFRDLVCSVACYIGDGLEINQLAIRIEKLLEKAKKNVACYRKVFEDDCKGAVNQLSDNITGTVYKFEFNEMRRWEELLLQGQNELVFDEVESLLEHLLELECFDTTTLFKFHQDFVHMYYHVLEEKQFDTRPLFKEKQIADLYIKSLNSVIDLQLFIRHLLNFKFDHEHVEGYYTSSIQIIKTFIQENLEKDLTRNELAELVFLNPEYLSRLFKKQTGVSLSTYITQERIKVSKELIQKTEMSVSIIASKVGYSNFSHFSQVFKKIVGESPLEFRQHRR